MMPSPAPQRPRRDLRRSASDRRCGLAGIIAALIAGLPGQALADVTGAVMGTLRQDDNVFALPSGDQPAGLRRSDASYAGTFDLDTALHPAGYALDLETDVTYAGFARNSAYNNFGYAFALNPHPDYTQTLAFSGALGARRALSGFAALDVPLRNQQTLVTLDPVVNWRVAGELVVVAAPVYDRSTNTAALLKPYDYERYGASFGVGWHTPLGNRIDLTVGERQTRGLGPRLISLGTAVIDAPTRLRDDRVDLAITYQITPATSISATATYLRRRDRTVLAHDVSAPFGEAVVRFHPSTGTWLIADIGWRLETLDQIFVDSVRTAYADVTAATRLGDRWRVYGRANFYRRRFTADRLATVTGYSVTAADRVEHSWHAEAGFSYALNSHVAANVNYAHELRTSVFGPSNYHENIGQLALIYVFGAHPEREFNLITGLQD